MKRLVLGFVLSLVMASTAAAHTVYPRDPEGLNVRSGPGTGHPVVSTLAQGEGAEFLGRQDKWYRVRLRDGREGWTASWVARLRYDPPAAGRVRADVLNVRAGPGVQFPVIGTVTRGQVLEVREIAGDWWQVAPPGGPVGWVSGAYMEEGPVAPPQPAPAPPPEPAAPSPPEPLPPVQSEMPEWLRGTGPWLAPPPPPAPGAGGPAPAPGGPAGADPAAYRLPSEREDGRVGSPKQVSLAAAEAPLRTGRSPRYAAVDRVRSGEPLTYVAASEGWVRVVSPRGVEGWLPGPLVNLQDPGQDPLRGPIYRLSENLWSIARPEVREVRPADGLRLRAAPDLGARVLEVVPQGTRTLVLARQGDWLQVRLPGGAVGWVAGSYTRPAGTGAGRVTSAVLERVQDGVFRLEVAGDLRGAKVAETGRGLVVQVPDPRSATADLPVAAGPVRALELGAAGVTLEWRSPSFWRVLESSAGRLVVEVRPAVTAVHRPDPGRDAEPEEWRVEVLGQVAPDASYADGTVVVSLPGAVLQARSLPRGVEARSGPDGLELRIPTDRAFALRPHEGGFAVRLYRPGLEGKRIVIDPGHGGDDPGAQNRALGVQEKAVNLAIATYLQAMLSAQGAEVHMTRTQDAAVLPADVRARVPEGEKERAELDYRTFVANALGADLFLSVHANAGGALQGTETYWSAQNYNAGRSRRLAALVQEELVRELGRPDRGVKEALFYVIRYTHAPSALAEVAFVSDPSEARLLHDPAFQQRAAAALARAVERFFAGPG